MKWQCFLIILGREWKKTQMLFKCRAKLSHVIQQFANYFLMSQFMINLENTFNCIHFIFSFIPYSLPSPVYQMFRSSTHTNSVNICTGEIVVLSKGALTHEKHDTIKPNVCVLFFLAQGCDSGAIGASHNHAFGVCTLLSSGDLALTVLILRYAIRIAKRNSRRMSFSLIS